MQSGFPIDVLRYLRCPTDSGCLEALDASMSFAVAGRVRCQACGSTYLIADGILSLLLTDHLHPESAREMAVRDGKNAAILGGARSEWSSRTADGMEVGPTLDAVGPTAGLVVLELGCGAGRYTLALATNATAVVAVDFSRAGLLLLRRKLAPDACVALVQADVTKPHAAPQRFDRVLSTLHSNLPDARHRIASIAHVAQSLNRGGRAVISMHHFSGRDRLAGVAASGRYPDSGIFRYYMTRAEAVRESAPFFARVRFAHIGASIPGLRSVTAARLAARLPLVRSALSRLFLAVCEQPRIYECADQSSSALARAKAS